MRCPTAKVAICKRNVYLSVFIATLLVLSTTSCTIQQHLTLNNTHSGSSQSNLVVSDFFIDVLDDMNVFLEGEDSSSFIAHSVNQVATNLLYSATATSVGTHTTDNNYTLVFDFRNFNRVLDALSGYEKQTIVYVDERSMKFSLSMDNYDQLENMVPFLVDPNFETFGPKYNEGMSSDDYLEMMSYIFGKGAIGALEDGVISLEIRTPSPIQEITHAYKVDSFTARFDIPLVTFLLLEKPIECYVAW